MWKCALSQTYQTKDRTATLTLSHLYPDFLLRKRKTHFLSHRSWVCLITPLCTIPANIHFSILPLNGICVEFQSFRFRFFEYVLTNFHYHEKLIASRYMGGVLSSSPKPKIVAKKNMIDRRNTWSCFLAWARSTKLETKNVYQMHIGIAYIVKMVGKKTAKRATYSYVRCCNTRGCELHLLLRRHGIATAKRLSHRGCDDALKEHRRI